MTSDRSDGWGLWRSTLAALVAGLLLGGIIGAAYGGSRAASFSAVTSLSVLPDSSVIGQVSAGTSAPTQDATDFIQSQLIVLNGGPLRARVRQQLKLAGDPALSSTQVGQTYVVQLVATADQKATALAEAKAGGEAYAALRRGQLGDDVNAAIRSVRAQVTSVGGSLLTRRGTVGAEGSALQDEYERLLAVSSALELAKGQAARAVTVVTPAGIQSGGLSRAAKDGVGGALLGALIGLALLLLRRRLVPRIRSTGDVTALGLPALLPSLPKLSGSPTTSTRGRLLASRIAGATLQDGKLAPVVVVGATRSVGVSFVVATLAHQLAERVPVLVLPAAEIGRGKGPLPSALATSAVDAQELLAKVVPSAVPGVSVLPLASNDPEDLRRFRSALSTGLLQAAAEQGWLVLVDAPPLDASDVALDCAASAAAGVAGVVVARRFTTGPADLEGAADLFDSRGLALTGIIVNEVPRGRAGRSPLVAPAPTGGSTPDRSSAGRNAPLPATAAIGTRASAGGSATATPGRGRRPRSRRVATAPPPPPVEAPAAVQGPLEPSPLPVGRDADGLDSYPMELADHDGPQGPDLPR